jgi:hypothetical protein
MSVDVCARDIFLFSRSMIDALLSDSSLSDHLYLGAILYNTKKNPSENARVPSQTVS